MSDRADHDVFTRRQTGKIGIHQRQRLLRARVFSFRDQKIPPRGQHVFLAGESRRRQLVMELAVTVVRRLFDKTELRTPAALCQTGIKNKRQCRAAANNIMATTLKVTRFIS